MVKLYNDGKRITAALSGDIDHHAAREIMQSSGIGLILGRLRAVRACGGDIIIKNARPEIAGVIKLSGLAGLLVETREVVK